MSDRRMWRWTLPNPVLTVALAQVLRSKGKKVGERSALCHWVAVQGGGGYPPLVQVGVETSMCICTMRTTLPRCPAPHGGMPGSGVALVASLAACAGVGEFVDGVVGDASEFSGGGHVVGRAGGEGVRDAGGGHVGEFLHLGRDTRACGGIGGADGRPGFLEAAEHDCLGQVVVAPALAGADRATPPTQHCSPGSPRASAGAHPAHPSCAQ